MHCKLFIFSVIIFICSCSTSVRVYQRDLSGVQTFSFEHYQYGTEDVMEGVINAMEQKGYIYAPGDKTGIVFTMRGGDSNLYNWHYELTAWYKQRPILIIKADNKGFGTLLAPESAKDNLYQKVCDGIEEKMPYAKPLSKP